MKTDLQEYVGKAIVVDTKSSYLYIGTLSEVKEYFLTLQEVDVHDRNEGTVSNELYIIEALKYGVKVNRKEVKIVAREIVSLSLLTDIVVY